MSISSGHTSLVIAPASSAGPGETRGRLGPKSNRAPLSNRKFADYHQSDLVERWFASRPRLRLAPAYELGRTIHTTTAPSLPPQLWRIRDGAVERALTNAPVSDDFGRITQWLEGDGWDALMESQGGEFVVSLASLADELTIDRDLYWEDWFDSDTAITDEARGRYLRERIDRCVEAADAGEVSTAYAYSLEREDGLSAVVGCLIDFQGQLGLEVGWLGVFPNWEAYIRDLRSRGFWLVDELAEITDDALLEAWRNACTCLRP